METNKKLKAITIHITNESSRLVNLMEQSEWVIFMR